MSDKLQEKSKYKEWLNSHTFKNCKLNRGEYGRFLADFITGEHHGFVLNLNGAWGSGKTEFLKRFYCELLERNHPVIYIDAWESDFSKEPLTVVASEVVSQLDSFNENLGDDFEKAKELLGKTFKAVLVGAAGYIAKQTIDDGTTGVEFVKQFLDTPPRELCKSLSNGHIEQVEAIKEIRRKLSLTAEVLKINLGCNIPVVVLIDELDRCRPSYSIEMLEVIKHFFNTENFVFVVASDTEQLCSSIKAVYGNDFDSRQYLKRFFDRSAQLPLPDIKNYIDKLGEKFDELPNVEFVPKISVPGKTRSQETAIMISYLSYAYGLRIRDIDQLVLKFDSCLRSIKANIEKNKYSGVVVNIVALTVAIIENEKGLDSFDNRGLYKACNSILLNDKMLDEGMLISQYVNISLKHTIYIRDKVEQNGFQADINRLPYKNEITRQFPDDCKTNVNKFADNLCEVNDLVRTRNSKKYLMWDEIKRVVELAGYLE